jgi:xylulose-5-phosphate/fructose-6-phosphate phosphoketolase
MPMTATGESRQLIPLVSMERPERPSKARLSAQMSCGTYWRVCNYHILGMIYLQDNPLIKEPLKPEHIKNQLL